MFGAKIAKIHFQNQKVLQFQKPILKLYDPKTQCYVFIGASSHTHGVGCVFKQENKKGVLHPMVYPSQNLKGCEKNYAVLNSECLPILNASEKFYHYVRGQRFVIHINHGALTWLKNIKNLMVFSYGPKN